MSAVLSKLQPTTLATILPIENLLDTMDSPSEMLTNCALDMLSKRSCQNPNENEWMQVEVDFLHPHPIQISEDKSCFTICLQVPDFNFVEVKIGVGKHHMVIKARMEQSIYLNESGFGPKNRRTKEILRLIRLPISVARERIVATNKIGILVITLPKIPAAKAASLAIAKPA